MNGKCEAHFLSKLNPRKFHWTQVFRRMHKKGITEEVAKKRTRRAVKMQRVFVGATKEEIKARSDVVSRTRLREAALKEAKEKKKDEQSKKKAEKAKIAAARGASGPAANTKPKLAKGSVKGKQGKR